MHQHLIKCGGTSLNGFISTKFYANRVLDASSIRNLNLSQKSLLSSVDDDAMRDILQKLVQYRIDHYDVVHGHSPLTFSVSEAYFKIIFLRDPVSRVFSQIMDWKRLKSQDLISLPEDNRNFKEYVIEHKIDDILDNWNMSRVGRSNLRNMQAKLIYKASKGVFIEVDHVDDTVVYETALRALDEYDYIGLTENMDSALKDICYLNKWCPPSYVTKLNANKVAYEMNQNELSKTRALNSIDIKLYNHVKNRTPTQNYSFYNLEYFESTFAEERTKSLSPVYNSGDYLFDFNMPIVGCGFHLRDAPNTSECAVWTGPDVVSSLFMPVVAGCDINVLVYIKGYSDPSVKKSLTIRLDGIEAKHVFVSSHEVESILSARHITTRSFVHIELIIKKCFSTEQDKRVRGLSLLKYGFRCNY